jgi:hypothetical protein
MNKSNAVTSLAPVAAPGPQALRDAVGVLYNVTGREECYSVITTGPAAGDQGAAGAVIPAASRLSRWACAGSYPAPKVALLPARPMRPTPPAGPCLGSQTTQQPRSARLFLFLITVGQVIRATALTQPPVTHSPTQILDSTLGKCRATRPKSCWLLTNPPAHHRLRHLMQAPGTTSGVRS